MGFLEEKRCAKCGKSEDYVSLDKHHEITQSRGGEEEDEIYLCRKCHRWVGNHINEAEKLGLYVRGYKIIGH